MKKIALVCLSLTLALSLAACGEKKSEAQVTPTPDPTAAVTPEIPPEVPAADPEVPEVTPETPEVTPEAPADEGTTTVGGNGGTLVTFTEGPEETPKPTQKPGIEASGMVPAKPGVNIVIKN